MMNEEKSILSPIQIGDLKKKDGLKGQVSDVTCRRIINETGGKAVIVIALAEPITASTAKLSIRRFHISAFNAEMSFLPSIFTILTQALGGILPGRLKIKEDDNKL